MNPPSIGSDRQPADQPPLLVVGAASRDIDPIDPRGWRLGGTVSYASLAAARLGVPVRALIGLDAEAAEAKELRVMRAAGVEIEAVRLRRGPVFENVETDRGRLQICHGHSDQLPVALPSDWQSPSAVILGPVADELGAGWATAFPDSTLIALGWQGLFRHLAAGRPVTSVPLRRRRLVARADIALVSRDDAAGGGAPLLQLMSPGQQLVVSGGARGALHVERSATGIRARRLTAIRARTLDTTGAGDVFLAAWCAGLLALRGLPFDARHEWRALALAVAAASLTVEGKGLAGVPDLAAVCGRLAQAAR